MRVLFMGSPDFALPSLHALTEHFTVVAVLTQPDRPAGRGRELTPPPVKKEAETYGLPILQPRKIDSETVDAIDEHAPDVIVVAAYGQLLPPSLLELPPHGCLNVHASLLPRWRGAAPIQAAILHGDEETGVTIMRMDAGLDTGPILSQRATPIGEEETGGELSERLAVMGADLLVETLPPYVAGELTPTQQRDQGATRAPLLRKADGRLDFRQSAARLARQVRAFEPWPGSFLLWKGNRLAVKSATSAPHAGAGQPGLAARHEGLPAVHTDDGLLVLRKVQPAGKRAMSGRAFLNGAQDFPGSQLPLPDDQGSP